MTKSNLTAAVAAILMATSPLAFAQSTMAPPCEVNATATNPTGTEILDNQFRASKWIGSTVYDLHNRDIGSIKDLIINNDGGIADVVVDVGTFLGMGGKYVAVPPTAIKTDNNQLTLDMTKEQLQQAQAYNLENPNTGSGSTVSPVTGGHVGSESGTNR
jgi:sporulation protein YlmC with PRC-barrel domain